MPGALCAPGPISLTLEAHFGIVSPVAIYAYSRVKKPIRGTQDAPIDLFTGKSDGKRVFLSIAYGENGHHLH